MSHPDKSRDHRREILQMPSYDSSCGLELPPPEDDALQHSRRLSECIVDRIEQRGGVIGFDEYMQMALY